MSIEPGLIVSISTGVGTMAASAFAVWRAVKTVLNGSGERIQKIEQVQDEEFKEIRASLGILERGQQDFSVQMLSMGRDIQEINNYGCKRYGPTHGQK